MRAACSIIATKTRSEYVILNAFPCNNGSANAPHCYIICTLPVLPYRNPSNPTLYTGLPCLPCPLHFPLRHSCLPTHISVFKISLYFLRLHLILNSVALFPPVSLIVPFSAVLPTPNKRPKLGRQLLSLLPTHLPLTQPEPCCGPTGSL